MEKRKLNIDIETYSSVDIKKSGAYKYAMSDDFEILLFAYSVDGGGVKIVDLAQGEAIPDEIVKLLVNKNCIKYAYNAVFEWWCLNKAGYITPINQWHCTMVQGLYCGYVAGLAAIGKALRLPVNKQKLSAGAALIKYFCVPCKPTRTNGGRTRNLPNHAPEKWHLFKEYCIRDVWTEMSVADILAKFPVPQKEWDLFYLDVEMNVRGVAVDTELITGALQIDEESQSALMEESMGISGIDNPNSTAQTMEWLDKQNVDIDNLQKATVSDALTDEGLSDDVKRVLEIRQELSKTSVKKYQAMMDAKCSDNRVRGLIQFYGANRTGRWAGRLVQIHNLPKNYLESLDTARDFVKKADTETIRLLYGNVPDTLSQLIRTAFIPSPGKQLVVSDFSAIEARVIAWLAREDWRMGVFKTHGKIYEASASQMFGVPLSTIVKGHENYALRAKGKVAELALGYQGSVGALKAMGADSMGLTDEELADIVRRWRASSKKIVALWYALENAAVDVLEQGTPVSVRGLVKLAKEVDIATGQKFMTIELPAGRKLYYPKPFLQENKFGQMQMHYKGLNKAKQWETIPMYGGKLVENIVQAIARDCLAETIFRINRKGWPIIFHVHDEVVLEVPTSVKLEEVTELMAEPIEWAPGLDLKAAGFVGDYYMKD